MHCHCGTNNRSPRWTVTDPCKPEVRPGAREESASPAWLAAPAMNARDTTKVYILRLDTWCGKTLYRKCHSHTTPGKRHNNTWVEPLAGNCTTSSTRQREQVWQKCKFFFTITSLFIIWFCSFLFWNDCFFTSFLEIYSFIIILVLFWIFQIFLCHNCHGVFVITAKVSKELFDEVLVIVAEFFWGIHRLSNELPLKNWQLLKCFCSKTNIMFYIHCPQYGNSGASTFLEHICLHATVEKLLP